jgi:hypothetical protein
MDARAAAQKGEPSGTPPLAALEALLLPAAAQQNGGKSPQKTCICQHFLSIPYQVSDRFYALLNASFSD